MNIIQLNSLLSEVSCVLKDNNINMYLEKSVGRGKKLIQISSVGYLKYDRFKQKIEQDNFIEQTLEALSCKSNDSHYTSNIINLCRYLVETYEK